MWLKLGRSELKNKVELLRRSLVGWFREISDPLPGLFLLESVVASLSAFEKGLGIEDINLRGNLAFSLL